MEHRAESCRLARHWNGIALLLAQIARGLEFSRADRVVTVIEDFGDTSSASLGIALDFLRRGGKIEPGDYLLLPAFAPGFTWGAALGRARKQVAFSENRGSRENGS